MVEEENALERNTYYFCSALQDGCKATLKIVIQKFKLLESILGTLRFQESSSEVDLWEEVITSKYITTSNSQILAASCGNSSANDLFLKKARNVHGKDSILKVVKNQESDSDLCNTTIYIQRGSKFTICPTVMNDGKLIELRAEWNSSTGYAARWNNS
eukprot:2080689-Ditylum_brightwellii.AAC.1